MTKKASRKFHAKHVLNKDVKSKFLNKFTTKTIEEITEDPYEMCMNSDMSLNQMIDEYVRKDCKDFMTYLEVSKIEEAKGHFDCDVDMDEIEEEPVTEFRKVYQAPNKTSMQKYAYGKAIKDRSKMYSSPSPKNKQKKELSEK